MPSPKSPTRFSVEGTYPFPVDMLRYDMCWPASTEDAVQMAEALAFGRRMRGDTKRIRKVTLKTQALSAPTTGRWESFGWKIV
jgi:hypothetical protein